MSGDFNLREVYPSSFSDPAIPDEIANLSQDFKTIYAQAAEAESLGLDQVAGTGYRKALEFLIKDYCISETPNDAEQIRKEFLGSCIKNRVSDAIVKECAERAVWLGNDETHYVRPLTSATSGEMADKRNRSACCGDRSSL